MRCKSLTPVVLVLLSSLVCAGVVRSTDDETGLVTWRFTEGGIEIELVQRLPDQTRGFFLARGFSSGIADDIATNCVFQTIIHNHAEPGSANAVTINLREWRMMHGGRESGISLKEAWDSSWTEDEVSQASRLAFRWATFPTQQTFMPGDYNWGMTLYGVPPGAVLDLKVVWQTAGETRSGWIKNMICPADVDSLK